MVTETAQRKRCGTCGRKRDVDQFFKNCRKRDGLTSQCKACHAQVQRNRRAGDRARRTFGSLPAEQTECTAEIRRRAAAVLKTRDPEEYRKERVREIVQAMPPRLRRHRMRHILPIAVPGQGEVECPACAGVRWFVFPDEFCPLCCGFGVVAESVVNWFEAQMRRAEIGLSVRQAASSGRWERHRDRQYGVTVRPVRIAPEALAAGQRL